MGRQQLFAIGKRAGTWVERLRHPGGIYAYAVQHQRVRVAFGLILALAMIYLALWTTPVKQIPSNDFDEPEWLYSSFCKQTIIPLKQPDVCQGMNTQTVDFSTTTQYIMGLARWVSGVPDDAVKYFYHIGEGPHDPLTADIRAAIVHVMTALSSISLLIAFVVLWRLYGGGPALTILTLLILTPYWRYTLRAVMADPGTFFFTILTWASTLWLVHLLLIGPRCSMGKILSTSACIGVCMAFGINARANTALLSIGFIAALLFVGIQTRTQWLVLVWASCVAFLSTACCWFALGTHLSWHASIPEQIRTIYLFNTVVPFGMLSGSILGPADSMREVLSSVFGLSYFTVIPALIAIPLCFVGMRRVFVHAGMLGRASGVWLLAVGGANLLANPVKIVPVSWDRYAMFFVFAVSIFMGIGIWHVAELVFRAGNGMRVSGRETGERIGALPPREYRLSYRIGTGACLVGAVAIAAVLVLSVLRASPEGKLWKAYIAAPTMDKKMDALSSLLERDRHARVIYNADRYVPDNIGQPVSEVLAGYFRANVDSWDPRTLRAVDRAGRILLTSSDDVDLRAHVRYDLDRLDRIRPLLSQDALEFRNLTNDLPAALNPTGWKEDPHELLVDPAYPIHTSMQVPSDGTYRVFAVGLNAPAAPVTVDVIVDAIPVGTLIYDRMDSSWTSASVVANLGAGEHRVDFQLAGVAMTNLAGSSGVYGAIRQWYAVPTADSGICRDARVPTGDTIAAGSCTIGTPAVILDNTRQRTVITVTAPIPALYDLALAAKKSDAQEQHVIVAVDGKRVDGVLPLDNIAARPYSALHLSPIYLTQGTHAIEVSRVAAAGEPRQGTTLTLTTLSLEPRYPDEHTLTPARFGAPDPGAAVLTGQAGITASWQWYGHNFGFYHLRVLGSAESVASTPLEVAVDGQVIGVAPLYQDGRLPEGLTLELANGAKHTITLRAPALTEGAKATIYSIDLTAYNSSLTFSATSMRWEKKDNGVVRSIGGTVLLPARVRITRPVNLPVSQRYRIIARVRRADAGGEAVILHLNADGWDVAETTVPATSDWTDQTFLTYLPSGAHDLQFWWDGGATGGSIDIMYFLVQ